MKAVLMEQPDFLQPVVRLITRVGTLVLRVPEDRSRRFSTEVFEQYQRSEKALVAALRRCMCREFQRARWRQ